MKPIVVLLRLVAFSPRFFITCVLFATLEMCILPIPIGLATRAFFDAVSGNEPAGLNAWTAIVLLVAIQIGQALNGPLLGNPWNALQQKSHVLLQWNMYAGILRGFGRHGLVESVGDSISRFRDDPQSVADGLDALCDLIARTLFAIFAIVVMWQINPLMTAVLFVPLLLSSVAMELLGRVTQRLHAASRAATSHMTGFLGELLGAQLAIKVAGATPNAVARLVQIGDVRRRSSVRSRAFGELLESLSVNTVQVFGMSVILLLAARGIGEGTFSVGDFALFVLYLDQLVWYPAEIARLINDLQRTAVSYDRMRALVPASRADALVAPAPLHFNGSPPALEPIPERVRLHELSVQRLSYAHPGAERGIVDVSFTLRRGTLTVITGRIGSGKTTLLHLLLGLLPRTRGAILWNGREVEDPASFFVPPRCAFTPQVPRLFSETLRENLLLGVPANSSTLQRAVRAAVLDRDIATLEQGMDTLVGPRGVKLSGGQIQRAAAARMFVRDAELLIMDDLSSALDTETEAQLWSRLFFRAGQVTCLVVSHRPAALRHADQILTMDGGRLVSTS